MILYAFPPNLQVIVIKADELEQLYLERRCNAFVQESTSVTCLAVIDECECIFYYYWFFTNKFLKNPLQQILSDRYYQTDTFSSPKHEKYMLQVWSFCLDHGPLDQIVQILDLALCDFDFFTVLMPVSQLTDAQLNEMHNVVQGMKLIFHLKTCFIGYEGGHVSKLVEDINIKMLEQWVEILCRDSRFWSSLVLFAVLNP